MTKEQKKEIREELAELEHEQWCDWSKNIFTTEKLSQDRIKRWEWLWRPYNELSEEEKESDRKYADRVLSKIDTLLANQKKELVEKIEKKRKRLEEPTSDDNLIRGLEKMRQRFDESYNLALDDIINIININ